jgi:hypothetical protein
LGFSSWPRKRPRKNYAEPDFSPTENKCALFILVALFWLALRKAAFLGLGPFTLIKKNLFQNPKNAFSRFSEGEDPGFGPGTYSKGGM